METSLAEMVSSKFSERLTLTQNTRWGGTEDTGRRPYFSNPHACVHTCTPICSYTCTHTSPHICIPTHTCSHQTHMHTPRVHAHAYTQMHAHRRKNIPLRKLLCCCLFFSCLCVYVFVGGYTCVWICKYMCAHACGGWRATLGATLRSWFALFGVGVSP